MTEAKPYSKSQQLGAQRKRYRRKVASRKQWEAIRAEKVEGQRCRVCTRKRYAAPLGGVLIMEAHHLIPRDRDGDDVAENIVGLCRDCHRGVELREPTHCRLMLTRLTDAEYAYAVEKCGEGWAERVYGVEYERLDGET